MRSRVVLGVMFVISIAGSAQDKRVASRNADVTTFLRFGDARFKVPTGWRHTEKQAGNSKVLLILPPEIAPKKDFVIAVLPGRDLPDGNFPPIVDSILKQGLAANERLLQYSEVPARKAAGYDLIARVMVIANNAGQRSFRICFAANPRHRLELMIVSANSEETLKDYRRELALLLNSWSFGDGTVPPETNKDETGAKRVPAGPERGNAGSAKVPSGTVTRVPDGKSVLLCADPARLDFAMDNAKNGNSNLALQALRHDNFFRATGPARLEVKAFDVKSRWPKALVTVLDGYATGRTGWVLLSELPDLKSGK